MRGMERNVELLLQQGCDPHRKVGQQMSPYALAKRDNHLPIVALFENNKKSVDELKRRCVNALEKEEISSFFAMAASLPHSSPLIFPFAQKGECVMPLPI